VDVVAFHRGVLCRAICFHFVPPAVFRVAFAVFCTLSPWQSLSRAFHSFPISTNPQMPSKVFRFNVVMCSVEETRQRLARVATWLVRVVRCRIHHVGLLVWLFQLWFVLVGV
jgi:hypothetical protein